MCEEGNLSGILYDLTQKIVDLVRKNEEDIGKIEVPYLRSKISDFNYGKPPRGFQTTYETSFSKS